MKRLYLTAAIVMVVTVAIVSQIHAAEAFRPAGPGLWKKLKSAAGRLARYIRRMADIGAAAALTDSERQVTPPPHRLGSADPGGADGRLRDLEIGFRQKGQSQ
jgi:hypothetical protein